MQVQPYIDKAATELLQPTLETTKQHLEVLDLQMENGQPVIARVNLHHTEDLAAVYFKVRNENFYLVVNLIKDLKIEPTLTWVESGHRVYLTATSEHNSYLELSEYLPFEPLNGWSKGEQKSYGKSVYAFSRVSFEPNQNMAFDLEEKLNELLTELEKDVKAVLKLAENANTCIAVVRYQYISGNTGIHLDRETIDRLHRLKLPIDIDTYISGNALKD